MYRTWIRCLLLAALATGTLAAHSAPALAAKSASSASSSSRSKYAYHQFTGYVTALDKETITVEKRGKQSTTRTFVRREGMTTTGELAREARVTVYYRETDGKAVAHKVVVKAPSGETASK